MRAKMLVLAHNQRKRVNVNAAAVEVEAKCLEDHVVVASFVGGRLTPTGFAGWLCQDQHEVDWRQCSGEFTQWWRVLLLEGHNLGSNQTGPDPHPLS